MSLSNHSSFTLLGGVNVLEVLGFALRPAGGGIRRALEQAKQLEQLRLLATGVRIPHLQWSPPAQT